MEPVKTTNSIYYSFLSLILFAFLFSCGQNDDLLSDFGSLELTISLDIETISTGRSQAVDTDNFKVTVFEEDGTEAIVFDPFSDVPNEVPLPVGRYYVVATSNNEQNAAFEEPFYYGETEVFTIDKEEEVSVTIDLSLANTQVSIIWSDNIIADFSDYKAKVTIIDSEDMLVFTKDETRSGYFITSPLSIAVTLTYDKIEGGVIEKTLNSSIQNPLPKSHYKLHLDASLENGVIVFNLNVDEGVDVIDIGIVEEKSSWQVSLGSSMRDEPYAMKQTSDGGYIVVGMSQKADGDIVENKGLTDVLIVKLDASGGISWQKVIGGSGHDVAHDVVENGEGDFILCGASESSDGDVASNKGSSDYWIVKLSSTGELIWESTYGGTQYDLAYSIDLTSDGGLIIAGKSTSSDGDISISNGSNDAWVIKLNSIGSLQWEHSFGGSNFEQASKIKQTLDGGFIFCGTSYSSDGDLTNNNGISDYWIVKIDNSGNLDWQKSYGGSGDDSAFDILESDDGGYLVGGGSSSSDGDILNNNGSYDIWILKLDSEGNISWQQNYLSSSTEAGGKISETNDGNFVIAGYTYMNRRTNLQLFKINDTGGIIWVNSLGGSQNDFPQSIELTNDGGFAIAARSESSDGDVLKNEGDTDFWILKLDSEGNL